MIRRARTWQRSQVRGNVSKHTPLTLEELCKYLFAVRLICQVARNLIKRLSAQVRVVKRREVPRLPAPSLIRSLLSDRDP